MESISFQLRFLLQALLFFINCFAKECTNTGSSSISHTISSRYLEILGSKSDQYIAAYSQPKLVSGVHKGNSSSSHGHDSLASRRVLRNLASGCQAFLEGASLHKIRLAPDTDHGRAQQTNLEYLLLLDVDSLVWSFRKNAGLSTPGSPYGGWEAPSSELRGHFVGHYLSATAMMWASTHNASILTKATNVVTALAECQRQFGTGYLSAFPTEFFDRFESLQPVWAPYYTIHKIMAGLLDQYVFVGNSQALYMVKLMADYFLGRVENVIRNHTIERHWLSLNEETGGMNDILYRLYAITGNAGHLKLAHLFDKPCFLGPLAVQADSLSGFHTNTHIPIIIGAQMRYEVVKDDIYKDIAVTFMDIVNSSHRYATGGTSVGEFWSDPNRLGSTLGTENEESCTTYNMLKVARNLFRWTKGMMYADYYERALLNGVLSIQNVEEPGVILYMLPLAPGSSKGRSYHGWGTKYNSFWCCYGTGIESFSKLGDSIYFQTKGGTPELYIIQFVSSTFTWDDANLLLTQTVSSWSSYHPLFNVTISFKTAQENGVCNTTNSNIYIRLPNWACSTGGQALVDGTKIELPDPGLFLNIFREWKSGDNINISLQVRLRIEKIQDDRPEYFSLYAIFFGPYLLVGMSDGDFNLGTVNMASLADWIVPVHPSAGQHLYTFGQRRKVGTVILRDVDGSVMMTPWQDSNKTNWAHHATFKMTTPVRHCTPRVAKAKTLFDDETFHYLRRRTFAEELMYRVISLESSHQPGKYIAHNGLNRKVTLFDQPRSCSYPIAGEEDLNAVFQVLPPLSHEEDHVSFEAAGLPGCFLYAESWRLEAAVELRCVEEEDEHFKFGSSFYVQEGLAGYHPMSFVAHGSNHTFLLVPFYAVRDENYTVYFQMN